MLLAENRSKVMKLRKSLCGLHVFGSGSALLRIQTRCFWESICPSLLHQSFICLCKNPPPHPLSVCVSPGSTVLYKMCFFCSMGGVGGGCRGVGGTSCRGCADGVTPLRGVSVIGSLACLHVVHVKPPPRMKTVSAARGVMQAVAVV